MKFLLNIFLLSFSLASAAAGLKGAQERKLFADPAGPAVISQGKAEGDFGTVTLGLLEQTYDGFCNLCAISAILNADQIYCVLCSVDLDGDNVDGNDPEQWDIPSITCFSSLSTVQVEKIGVVSMTDLQLGAHVLTQNGKYEPVYAFGHKNPTKLADFLQFQMAETTLEMTGGHLVFLDGKTNPVRADSIKVGDVFQGEKGKVFKINTVSREGVYSPLTPSGTVVVDGIVASTYISLQKHASEFVEFQGGVSSFLSFQDFIHMILSPFRMFCMGVSPSLGNTYTEDGIPLYAWYGIELAQWADKQNIFLQICLFLAVGTLTGAFMFVENTFGATGAPLALIAGTGIYSMIKKENFIFGGSKVKSV